MKPYIFGARNGVYIIDLQQTVELARKAFRFVADTVARGGSVLFVGTKKQAQDVVAEEARRANQFYVTHRWLGGTLTNFKTVKQGIERLKTLEKMRDDGTFDRLPKKEVSALNREMEKLERNLGGIKEMTRLPGVIFVIDPRKEHLAVHEANRLGIPVVGLVDTNCDPDGIDFVIPANDDAIRSIRLFSSQIANAALEGLARYAATRHEQGEEETRTAQPEEGRRRERRGAPRGERRAARGSAAEGGEERRGPEVEVVRRPTLATQDEAEAEALDDATESE
jgi:small subunit ribosomal protein S2